MKRRQFIALCGGTAAITSMSWPLAARAQPGIPVEGFLNAASAEGYAPLAAAFVKGLGEAGYIDGRNVTVEYRWAEGHNERLPALAADLVRRQVAVIAATSTPAAARTLGLGLHLLNASSESDFDAVFAELKRLQASGFVMSGGDPFFVSRSRQLGALAASHAIPAVGAGRDFVAGGGLIGYGADIADAYRLTGGSVGHILKREQPADLPVQQATRVELLLNLRPPRRSASPCR